MAVADDSALHWFRRFVHFWMLVWRSFVRNRGLIRASALAYTTLLALIPLLAVGLGALTRLLKNSEQQTDELIQTVVDELAPQLGLSPVTAAERAEVRPAVEKAFGDSLPALLDGDATKTTHALRGWRPSWFETCLRPSGPRGDRSLASEAVAMPPGAVRSSRPELNSSARSGHPDGG